MHLLRLIRTRAARALGISALAVVAGFMLLRSLEPRARHSRSAEAAAEASDTGARLETSNEPPPRTRDISNLPKSHPSDVPEVTEAGRLIETLDTSDEPLAVQAALERIPKVYAARSTKKPGPSADLERVLVAHVRSERPETAAAALSAAQVALMGSEPSRAVASAIADLTAPEHAAPRRYAALDALNLLRPDRRAPEVLSAFERSLDAKQPELVSLALLLLSQSGRSIEALTPAERAKLALRVLRLLDHYDPGVRGRALAVLAEVPALGDREARIERAGRALGDREAYVRAQAADLLSRCREPMAIHALIEHVADLSSARYELRGFTRLDGAPGTLVHEVPGRPRVAEAALFAIRSLSTLANGVPPLTITLGDRDRSEALILENAERARSYYRAHQAAIPRSLGKPTRSP